MPWTGLRQVCPQISRPRHRLRRQTHAPQALRHLSRWRRLPSETWQAACACGAAACSVRQVCPQHLSFIADALVLMFGRTCLTARGRGDCWVGSIPPRLHVVPQRFFAAIGKPAEKARILVFRHTLDNFFRHFDFTFGYHRCFSTVCRRVAPPFVLFCWWCSAYCRRHC